MSGRINLDNISDDFKSYLQGLGLTEEQVNEAISLFVGDKENLQTENKDSLVDAINELFQNANNGKELIANVIGSPLSSDDTFNAMSDKIEELINNIRSFLADKGVDPDKINGLEDIVENLDKVESISIKKAEELPQEVVDGQLIFLDNDVENHVISYLPMESCMSGDGIYIELYDSGTPFFINDIVMLYMSTAIKRISDKLTMANVYYGYNGEWSKIPSYIYKDRNFYPGMSDYNVSLYKSVSKPTKNYSSISTDSTTGQLILTSKIGDGIDNCNSIINFENIDFTNAKKLVIGYIDFRKSSIVNDYSWNKLTISVGDKKFITNSSADYTESLEFDVSDITGLQNLSFYQYYKASPSVDNGTKYLKLNNIYLL